MKMIILYIYFISLLGIVSCEKNNDEKITISTGVIGIVEYGIGDCMPIIDGLTRVYNLYNGDLYFIVKSDLDNLGNGDFEQLKENSLKTYIKDGVLAVELPVDTFLVMPTDVYKYSDDNTVIIEKGVVLEKNFKFWKCTSY